MTTIIDYDTLQTAISDTLGGNTSIPADRCIQLAEAEFGRRLFNLEGEEEATTSTVADDPTLSFPGGFQQLRSIYLDTDPREKLEYMTPDNLRTYWSNQVTGKPQNYTLIANEIEIAPAPDGVYTVVMAFTRTLTALSTDNTTNWLLTSHPDLYLYASLVHAELFGWNDERVAAIFRPAVEMMIAQLNDAGLKKRFPGTIRMRPSVQEVI